MRINQQFLTALSAFLLQTVTSLETSPHVFVTVSSLATVRNLNSVTERQIQLNWFNAEPEDGDWVGLFDHDTDNGNVSNHLTKMSVISREGVYTTKISMPRQDFEGELLRKCLGFWVAYVRNEKMIASNCIKIEPNWMHEHRHMIGNSTFSDLFIPGTHDAGSFRPYSGWRQENPISKYLLTQDEDLWTQFVYGIRHVDLRIGFYETRNEFFINHNKFRVNPFYPELQNIRKFLDSTKEFLILDFHGFETGFDGDDAHECHARLVALLKSALGHLIAPRKWGNRVTLDELWNANQRVMIMYNDEFYKEDDLLWPGMYQAWANTVKVDDLKSYFTNVFNTPKLPESFIWSAQAELTTDALFLATHPYVGTRVLADKVNIPVTYWFQDLWWEKANCVATDYFLGNNMIEVAIHANKRRRDLNANRI